MLEKLIQRTKFISPFLAASLLAGCIAPQKHTWKTESIVSTTYKPIKQETEQQDVYKIVTRVSDTGELNFRVGIGKYDVKYDVVQPVNLTRERQYDYGRSKAAATWADIGFGTVALGFLLETVTTSRSDCGTYNGTTYCKEVQGSVPAHLVLTTGLLTTGISGLVYWNKHGKKSRPTKNYHQVEIPAETYQRNIADKTLLETVPAIDAAVTLSSSYFTMDGQHTTTATSDYNGNGSVQLVPANSNYSFTVDGLSETSFAKEVFAHKGVNRELVLSQIQENATPVTYDVTLTVTPRQGDPVAKTASVKGFEIPQKAMEHIIMGL